MRVKFNMELEEKKLKIAYLNNEKYELDVKNKTVEKELDELKRIFDNSKKEYIEFHTQIKILRQTLEEKRENIEMLTEEVDTWRTEYDREVHSHSYTQQTVTALEIKIQSLQKDKQKVY
jgi:chromosome segregation ATPase